MACTKVLVCTAGVAVTACQETIFSIVLIAVDKYLYICHGLKYSFLVTSKRVYAALGVSWFLSVLIGKFLILFWFLVLVSGTREGL